MSKKIQVWKKVFRRFAKGAESWKGSIFGAWDETNGGDISLNVNWKEIEKFIGRIEEQALFLQMHDVMKEIRILEEAYHYDKEFLRSMRLLRGRLAEKI